jgi:hypothetical protein
MLSLVRTDLDTSSRSVVQLRQIAKKLPQPDRSQFDSAYAEVRMWEVELRKSILEASQASSETAPAAQAKVASDYEAYARALTVADAAARALRPKQVPHAHTAVAAE